MIVSIHQPQYIPWIPYFSKIHLSDLFVLLDDVQYQKNGLQNRNYIYTQNGTTRLTLSVKGKLGDKINQITLFDKRELSKHWKTIEQAYKKAPYFGELQPELAKFYTRDYTLLEELCSDLILFLCKYIGINTKIIKSSSLQKQGEKSALILNICQQLKTTTYISGSGGLDYLDQKSFADANIKLQIMEYKVREYKQVNNKDGFVKELSIFDLVFNVGKSSIEYL
jgi:hypothetical protein